MENRRPFVKVCSPTNIELEQLTITAYQTANGVRLTPWPELSREMRDKWRLRTMKALEELNGWNERTDAR